LKVYNLYELRNLFNSLQDFSHFKLIDIPVRVKDEYYESSVKKVNRYFSEKEEVLGSFLCGNLKGDGISDIDILIVVKSGCGLKSNFFQFLNENEKRLFIHQLFVIPEECLDYFKYMVPFYNLNPLFVKRNFKLSQNFVKEKFYGKLFMVKNLISFLRSFMGGLLKVRGLLLLLNGMKYDLKIFRDFFGDSSHFEEGITSLRRKWFYLDDEKRYSLLFELFKKGILYTLDFFESEDLGDFASYLNYFSINQYLNVYFKYGNKKNIKMVLGGKYFSRIEFSFKESTPLDEDFLEFFRILFNFGKKLEGDVSLPIPSIFLPLEKGLKLKIFEFLNGLWRIVEI